MESSCRQRGELVAPRVPALRKAWHKTTKRPFALLGKVDVDAVRLDHASATAPLPCPVDRIELEDGITCRRSEPRYEFAPSHLRSPC